MERQRNTKRTRRSKRGIKCTITPRPVSTQNTSQIPLTSFPSTNFETPLFQDGNESVVKKLPSLISKRNLARFRSSKVRTTITRADLFKKFTFLCNDIITADISAEKIKKIIECCLGTMPYFNLNLTPQRTQSNSKARNRMKVAASQTLPMFQKPQKKVGWNFKSSESLPVAGQVLNSLSAHRSTRQIVNSVSPHGSPSPLSMNVRGATSLSMKNCTSTKRISRFIDVDSPQVATGLTQTNTETLNPTKQIPFDVISKRIRGLCKKYYGFDPSNYIVTDRPYLGHEPRPKAMQIAHSIMAEILKNYILTVYYEMKGIPHNGVKPPHVDKMKQLLLNDRQFMNVIKQIASQIRIPPQVDVRTLRLRRRPEASPLNFTKKAVPRVTPKIQLKRKKLSLHDIEQASNIDREVLNDNLKASGTVSLSQPLTASLISSIAEMLLSKSGTPKLKELKNFLEYNAKNKGVSLQNSNPLKFEKAAMKKLKRIVISRAPENGILTPHDELENYPSTDFSSTLAEDISKCMNPVFAKESKDNFDGDLYYTFIDPLVLYGINLHNYVKNIREMIAATELAIEADFFAPINAAPPMPKRPKITPTHSFNSVQFMPKDYTKFSMGTDGTYPEMNTDVVKLILRQNIAAIVGMLGFDTTFQSVLDVLVDVLIEFYKKIGYRLKIAAEDAKRGWLNDFPNIAERVLMEIGMGGSNKAHEFYKDRVVKYINLLEKKCQDLNQEYQEIIEIASCKRDLDSTIRM